jgi:hypothetical protein
MLFGVGPFEFFESDYQDLTYHGKPGNFRMNMAFAQAGNIELELIQPLSGENIYTDFVQQRGQGLHHIGIKTADIDQAIKRMEAEGFRVIQSGCRQPHPFRPTVKWAYLSADDETGVIFELVQIHRDESLKE